MSIWNKILVGLIGVASLAFFYMAARTLKTHEHWRQRAAEFDRAIERVQKDNDRLANGVGQPGPQAELGIRQLRVALNNALLNRHRVWSKCGPRGLSGDGKAVRITLTVPQPDPSGIPENAVVYGFSEANAQDAGHYLGAFKVVKADQEQKQVILTPTWQPSTDELERLAAAKGLWELHEFLPQDSHDVFASLTDEQKKALLPASWQEYCKDGKPAAGDDPADCVADGKYVRQLRDYQVLFNAQHVARMLLLDKIAAVTTDKQLVEEALAKAQQQETALKASVAAATEEKDESIRQSNAVKKYREIVQRDLDDVKKDIDRRIKANRDIAGGIAIRQLEAARRIDDRTREVARSGGTGGS